MLMNLKIQNNKSVSTQTVMKEFADNGINVSLEEFQTLFADEPFIKSINQNQVIFNTDNTEYYSLDAKNSNKDTVNQMAKNAIQKRT